MNEMKESDTSFWFGTLEAMFGIPPERMSRFKVVRLNSKHVHVVAADLEPPDEMVSAGITLFATKMAVPKLSTAAAMAFGDAATRMVMDVTRAEADAYLARKPFYPTESTASRCDEQGYVVVRFEEISLGVGFYRTERVDRPMVDSHFPKAWMISEDDSAFIEERT